MDTTATTTALQLTQADLRTLRDQVRTIEGKLPRILNVDPDHESFCGRPFGLERRRLERCRKRLRLALDNLHKVDRELWFHLQAQIKRRVRA